MQESKNFGTNYLSKFLIDLVGIGYGVMSCLSGELGAHLISSDQYSKEGTLLL